MSVSRLADMTLELMRDIDDYLAELDHAGASAAALQRPCYCGRRIYAHVPYCTGPSPQHTRES